jgi:hypothetical protein
MEGKTRSRSLLVGSCVEISIHTTHVLRHLNNVTLTQAQSLNSVSHEQRHLAPTIYPRTLTELIQPLWSVAQGPLSELFLVIMSTEDDEEVLIIKSSTS